MTRLGTSEALPAVPEATAFVRAIDAGEILVQHHDEGVSVHLGPRDVGRYEALVKPAIDRVGAAVLLLLLLPVLVAVALAVRVGIGPGVLYRQRRVGRDGVPFEMLKFRTMRRDRREQPQPYSGPERRTRHKSPEDPRHTTLGRILRASSLDELPQLWNVLRGEMSLIGPRPELEEIVANYADWQHRRHDVKPGLTGLWQVTERDEEGNMHLYVTTDLVYVANVSFWFDLRLLVRTIPAVLGGTLKRSTF